MKNQRYSKYGAKKTVSGGIKYDSKAEASRAQELYLMERAGKIAELERQKKFELLETFRKNGKTYRGIFYVADFYYYDFRKKCYMVEDVKSVFTAKNPVYIIKKKLFEYKYRDLTITEVIR